jgi:hypothetical protein
MSLYATLHTHSTNCNNHGLQYITRGASARLVYSLQDKLFKFEDILQFTVTFKQGEEFVWFDMFRANFDDHREIDPHFYHFTNSKNDIIIFNLTSDETRQLKPGISVEYEIAIKIASKEILGAGEESLVIETLPPLEVKDSLYSYTKED